jgi:hypothetical protein
LTELGRLLDKVALENDGRPRAKTAIHVPAAWARETALVEVALPRTLACARCGGGGCDGCGRSGALHGPASAAARRVRVRLPEALGDGVAMRIADPFGRASPIVQLWIEVRPASAPSASVRRISGKPQERRRILPRMVLGLLLVVTLLAGVLVLLTWLRK